MDADGGVLKRSKYPNTRKGVNMFIDILAEYDCIAACESTVKMWIKTYEEFERRSIPITLANPYRLKMSQSGVKTDKIYAQKLANKLRLKDIPACYVLGLDTRRIMNILRQRVLLVQERTRYLNRQHITLDKYECRKARKLDVKREAPGVSGLAEAGAQRHGAHGAVRPRRQAYQLRDIAAGVHDCQGRIRERVRPYYHEPAGV